MGAYQKIIRYSNILSNELELNKIVHEDAFYYHFNDETPFENQKRKLKDTIKILKEMSKLFIKSESVYCDKFAIKFYKKFLEPLNDIKQVNEATEIFLAALLIEYRQDMKILSVFKNIKSINDTEVFLNRKDIFISAISNIAISMNRIEYKVSKYDDNNKENIKEREISWLQQSSFNYYDGGLSGKEITSEVDNDYYNNYVNKLEPNKAIIYAMPYELMQDSLHNKFIDTHKPYKPFWDSIVLGFFHILYLFFMFIEETIQSNCSIIESMLDETLFISRKLPRDKKILFLKNNERMITNIHNRALNERNNLTSNELQEYSGILKMSRIGKAIQSTH
jgi:hypothetical protein